MYVIITCKYEKGPIMNSPEKVETSFFPVISLMGIFSDVQGQLTPQSVVQSVWNSNSSELSCMSLLPASMKRNGWKTAQKKWRHCCFHHNPVCYHGNCGRRQRRTTDQGYTISSSMSLRLRWAINKENKSVLFHIMTFFMFLLVLPYTVTTNADNCMHCFNSPPQKQKAWGFFFITLFYSFLLW